MSAKSIYFASDFHLGADTEVESSKNRELKILRWLDSIKNDCDELYLLGDLFDYWFEYIEVIPKGHVRFLAKLASFVDSGIPVHIFTGNHDMWMFSYFQDELGAIVHRKPINKSLQGKKLQFGHGDGLGPGDHGYKFIKKIFGNPISQLLFARLHPNLAIRIMRILSQRKDKVEQKRTSYKGADQEWLIKHCEKEVIKDHIDYFIFGHRHLPIDFTLSNGTSRYINLGDMIHHNTYAVLKNGNLSIQTFENQDVQIFGN